MRDRRILLVEDEYWLAVDLQQQAEDAGASIVGPAATVTKALELVASERIDGAIIDINLGGELAFPVADALQARGVPFVFLSGYDGGSVPARFSTITHCNKPADPTAVFRALFR